MINNPKAKTMLSNSEFVVMLNQDKNDRDNLVNLYGIPEEMLVYITDAPAGSGIIKCSNQLIPFSNSFPTNTELYRMMSTKANEEINNFNVTVNKEELV